MLSLHRLFFFGISGKIFTKGPQHEFFLNENCLIVPEFWLLEHWSNFMNSGLEWLQNFLYFSPSGKFSAIFPKNSDKHDTGGREVQADSDINTKKIMHKRLFFTFIWSAR